MRRLKTSTGIFGVVILVCLCGIFRDSAFFTANAGDQGILPQVSGTYLLGPAPELITFSSDGTYVLSNSAEFGFELPFASSSNEHGTWERSGPLEITSRSLAFFYDESGQHTTTARFDIVWTFDDATFGTGIGVVDGNIFLASADPLDPATPPIFSFEATVTLRRVDVP